MLRTESKSKSPLTLLLIIACLVISTLVMISNYFLRPGLELDLRNRVVSKLYSHNLLNPVIEVEGRDVFLTGIAPSKAEAKKIETDLQGISGIHHVDTKLQVDTQTD